ncbi:MAG: phospho-sugar mutase [Acidimicrobiia bacterium]
MRRELDPDPASRGRVALVSLAIVDHETLAARTRAWIEGDPDPSTRDELEALLDARAYEDLAERMAGGLEFGTAGLRGKVEGGSNRMNRAVVIRTTRGVVEHLVATGSATDAVIVVGRDARLSSEEFMRDTVGVLAAAGLRVRYFPNVTPTPLVAYAARRLGARLAIVVTASHNPRWDNGYKVFDENGAQIVPPVDSASASAIESVRPANEVPRIRDPYGTGAGSVSPVPEDLFGSYLEELHPYLPPAAGRGIRIVHTPFHGVGGRFTAAALQRCGGHEVVRVDEQFEPDGRFPTVPFPNPEEPGSLDLALTAAVDEDADLVLANDPDTDRLGVAVPDDGSWRVLTGNQIGVLLADRILSHSTEHAPVVLSSIVSTPMIAAVSSAHSARYERTLTGFKWIWNAALDIERDGGGTFVFGFEEALGFSVAPIVRDKDGISAAVVFADLAAAAAVDGRTVLDLLGGLYARHGLWVSSQLSVHRTGSEGRGEIEAAVREAATLHPGPLGPEQVIALHDYSVGAEHRPRYLGAANLVELSFASGGRVLVRPSGTEPKLKIYTDLRTAVGPGDDWKAAERDLLERSEAVASALALRIGLQEE